MIEFLEPRRLFTVTLTGTPGADTFELQQQTDGRVFVWVNRPETLSPNLKIGAGVPIVVNGGGGDDTVLIDNLLAVPVTVNADGVIGLADAGQDLTVSGVVTINIGEPNANDSASILTFRDISGLRHPFGGVGADATHDHSGVGARHGEPHHRGGAGGGA